MAKMAMTRPAPGGGTGTSTQGLGPGSLLPVSPAPCLLQLWDLARRSAFCGPQFPYCTLEGGGGQ